MKGRAQLLRLCLPALLVSSVATAACTKTEGTSSGTTSNTVGVSTTTPSASAATAAPDASPVAADATTGTTPTGGADGAAPTTSATAVASGASGAAPKASSSANTTAAAVAECGTKPLPDCPLQAWMKANTNPAIASNDLPALATALDKTAGFAPAGYGNWASIAKDGAKAAKAGDMTAAKASCRTCHDQYKDKYKKDTALRARKI